MADLKYPAELMRRMWSAEVGGRYAKDLSSVLSYAEQARALMRESALMLGHFTEGLPADSPDRQEAEALISRLGKTIGD